MTRRAMTRGDASSVTRSCAVRVVVRGVRGDGKGWDEESFARG